MGTPEDVRVGAMLRAHGSLGTTQRVDAQMLAILTSVARIIDA